MRWKETITRVAIVLGGITVLVSGAAAGQYLDLPGGKAARYEPIILGVLGMLGAFLACLLLLILYVGVHEIMQWIRAGAAIDKQRIVQQATVEYAEGQVSVAPTTGGEISTVTAQANTTHLEGKVT